MTVVPSHTVPAYRILIVDDDAVDRLTVRRALAQAGVSVEIDEADSADGALAHLRATSHHCVLLDYHIPGSDGLSLLRSVHGLLPQLPVVMLTGQRDDGVAAELMKAGAADYLSKGSLTPERLEQSLRHAIALADARTDVLRAQEALRATAERLRLATECGGVGTWDTDLRTDRMVWDERFRLLLGIPLDAEPSPELLLSHVHPADRERVQRERRRAADPTGDGRYAMECRVVDPDGSIRWVDARGRALFEEDGAHRRCAVRLIGAAVDVTAAKRLEDALRDEAQIVETLQQIGGSLTAVLDLDRIVRTVTEQATKLVGARFGVFFHQLKDARDRWAARYTVVGVQPDMLARLPRPPVGSAIDSAFRVPIRSDDIASDPRRSLLPVHLTTPGVFLPVASCLAVPVVGHSGEVLAGLFLGHPEPHAFTARHERLVTGIAGWAATAIDNARLYESEQRARSAAERANRAKADFLSRMSHDLRTPLTAIRGYAQLVAEGTYGPVTEMQRVSMASIVRAQEHLLALIRDILSYARIEAGTLHLDLADVPVNAMLGGLEALVEPQFAARGLVYEYIPGPPEVRVRADQERCVQVLLNLLTNAVKFTERGSVTVSWSADEHRVRIHVRDTGPGIPAHRLAEIFEPFVQGGRTGGGGGGGGDAHRDGVGLGLAISRELARSMGGDLTVESREGAGATFTLELPRAPGRAAAPFPSQPLEQEQPT